MPVLLFPRQRTERANVGHRRQRREGGESSKRRLVVASSQKPVARSQVL